MYVCVIVPNANCKYGQTRVSGRIIKANQEKKQRLEIQKGNNNPQMKHSGLLVTLN